MGEDRINVLCRVGKGLSEEEYIVRLQDADGKRYETWADRTKVTVTDPAKIEEHEARGMVRVRAVELGEQQTLIELPNETLSGGRRVWIKRDAIVA